MQISTITGQIPFIGRKKRQQEVFWNLAQEHVRFLYNAAFRYVGNRHDAEDLVQETLYTGYSKFHQLRDDRKFKSWMFRVGEVSDVGHWFTRRLGYNAGSGKIGSEIHGRARMQTWKSCRRTSFLQFKR